MQEMPELVLGPSATQATQTIFEVGAPLSPFHYHLRKVGSLFYLFFSFFLFYWMAKADRDGRRGGYLTLKKKSTSNSGLTFTDGSVAARKKKKKYK